MTFAPEVRPVWLLDVDGVLNAARPGWDEVPGQGKAFVDGTCYRLRWAPPLTRRITALHHSGAVEIRWATTWVDHITQVERLLRLPKLPTAFIGLDPDEVDPTELKVCAALDVVELERRPLIWTDDDAIPGTGPLLDRLQAAGVPVLLLAPGSRIGLQPEDLDVIDDFLTELTAMAS
ncbi:MAG: hypothetical protein WAL50_19925 [Kineosporiaceae bacterium]